MPIAAVALGACVIEKHVTLRRDDGGVDSDFSLEPDELAAMVPGDRRGPAGRSDRRGSGRASRERDTLALRRSLYVVADVRPGTRSRVRTSARSARPGGLHPDTISTVVGREFTRDVPRGTPLTWELI